MFETVLSLSLRVSSLLSFSGFSLSTAKSLHIGGSLASPSLWVALVGDLTVGLSRFSGFSLSTATSPLSRCLSDFSVSLTRWLSTATSLSVALLDGDGPPSRRLSSNQMVNRLFCCSILHVFRFCLLLF